MNYLIVAMVIMGVIVVAVRRRRFFASFQLRNAFYLIQNQADTAMLPAPSRRPLKKVAKSMLVHDAHSFELNNGFRCACWMTKTEDGIEHAIVGIMQNEAQKKLVQQMLLVMSELSSTFKEVGIQDKIKFNIASAGDDTHLLLFTLSSRQHEDFMAHVRERTQSE